MFRFLLFGIVATLFVAVNALPADTDSTDILRRGNDKQYKTTHTKRHHHTKTKPAHYPTKTPIFTCPGTGYYVQHVQDGEYAQINLRPGVGSDVFEVDLTSDTEATATVFSFVQSNGGCQLTVFPTAAIPNAAGFRSTFYTSVGGIEAGTFYNVFISGPVGSNDPTLDEQELYCQPNADLILTCSFIPGGPLQALSDQFNTLYVSGGGDTSSDTFQLIPVV